MEPRTPPGGGSPRPPLEKITILPSATSVSISSGQTVTVNFTLVRINDDVPVTLSLSSLPKGVTAALSPQSLPSSDASQKFSLTLTAAPDVTPAQALIEIMAGPGPVAPHASVDINAQASGQVRPSYQLLTVLYAPPGTNGGRSSSEVDYGSGSTTGTKDSTSSSFKDALSVKAEAGVTIGNIVKLGVSGDFTASQTTGDTSSISINKSSTFEISAAGPAEDGINHGYDMFYLWLNPLLNVTVDSQNNITWQIGVDGPTMHLQYAYATWLQNPSLMPPGVAQALAAAGLTSADYAQILASNPFVSGGTQIDPNRYLPTSHSFPYEPPLTAADPVPTMKDTLTSSTTVESTQEVENKYGVSATVSAGFEEFYNSKLTVTGSLEWTNTSTSTQITGSSQSAGVTIGGPAFGYKGPTDILVYWDTLFNTFMFAFATGTAAASGTLTDSAGTPVPYQALTLTVGGQTLSTFTDSHGNYRFYGAAPGEGTISVGSSKFTVAIGPDKPSPVLRITPPVGNPQ